MRKRRGRSTLGRSLWALSLRQASPVVDLIRRRRWAAAMLETVFAATILLNVLAAGCCESRTGCLGSSRQRWHTGTRRWRGVCGHSRVLDAARHQACLYCCEPLVWEGLPRRAPLALPPGAAASWARVGLPTHVPLLCRRGDCAQAGQAAIAAALNIQHVPAAVPLHGRDAR